MDDLISRKAVLSILHNKAFDSVRNDEKYNLLRWCMKQIESLPTIQPQGYDKNRLIEYLKRGLEFEEIQFGEKAIEVINTYRRILAFVDSQPTSDGWIPVNDAVDIGYLHDWYIASVMDDEPVWTEKHLEELFNDFILIPKPLPPAYKESE